MKTKNDIYFILNKYIKNRPRECVGKDLAQIENFIKHIGIGIEYKNNKQYLFVYDFAKKKRISITKLFEAMAQDYMLVDTLCVWQIDEIRDFAPAKYKDKIRPII